MDKRQQEIEELKLNSPYALPDNPSQSGWSAGQIKEKFYVGLFYLLEKIQTVRENCDTLTVELQNAVTDLEYTLVKIITGELILSSAKKDAKGNIIDETYAKLADLLNGTVGVLKYLTKSGSTELVSAIEPRIMEYVSKIQNMFEQDSVKKAVADKLGNQIHTYYESKNDASAKLVQLRSEINTALTAAKNYTDQKTISAIYYRGQVNSYEELPTNPTQGDAYQVLQPNDEHEIQAGEFVAWNGTSWQDLGGLFDTSKLNEKISELEKITSYLATGGIKSTSYDEETGVMTIEFYDYVQETYDEETGILRIKYKG